MVSLKDSPLDFALLAVILLVAIAAIWQQAWFVAVLAFILLIVAERQADIVLSLRDPPDPDTDE